MSTTQLSTQQINILTQSNVTPLLNLSFGSKSIENIYTCTLKYNLNTSKFLLEENTKLREDYTTNGIYMFDQFVAIELGYPLDLKINCLNGSTYIEIDVFANMRHLVIVESQNTDFTFEDSFFHEISEFVKTLRQIMMQQFEIS